MGACAAYAASEAFNWSSSEGVAVVIAFVDPYSRAAEVYWLIAAYKFASSYF